MGKEHPSNRQRETISEVLQEISIYHQVAGVISMGGSWPMLWDSALRLGSRNTTGLRNLSGLMGHHGHDSHPWPLWQM